MCKDPQISNDMSTMLYNFPEFVELYDTTYGKFSFYRTCKAGKHVQGRVLQVIRLSNEGGGKRVTTWAAHYHTSRRSWYPKPEGGLLLSQVPVMKPLPIVNMSPADCNALRNWASSYGAAVRQRTVRQETTMARHGTLPEFMYQR